MSQRVEISEEKREQEVEGWRSVYEEPSQANGNRRSEGFRKTR